MGECEQVVQNHIDKIITWAVVFAVIIDFHFGLVVYTHWRNGEEGGC